MQFNLKKNKKIKSFEKLELRDFADGVWKKILLALFSLLILGVAGALGLFFYISGIFDKSTGDEDEVKSLILDRKNLDEALEFSEDKKASLENAKENLPETIDPSTPNSYSLEQPMINE